MKAARPGPLPASATTSAATRTTGSSGRVPAGDGTNQRVEVGPNRFSLTLGGRQPPVAGGNFLRQAGAAVNTVRFTAGANLGFTGPRRQTDVEVTRTLRKLKRTPIHGAPTTISVVTYRSVVPAHCAKQVYDAFVLDPETAFSRAGMRLRPRSLRLLSGQRLMMEDTSLPALRFPVELAVDGPRMTVAFHTLEGHVLRGTNTFEFKQAGPGQVEILQTSEFQASSMLTTVGMTVTNALEHQHSFWKSMHDGLYERRAAFAAPPDLSTRVTRESGWSGQSERVSSTSLD